MKRYVSIALFSFLATLAVFAYAMYAALTPYTISELIIASLSLVLLFITIGVLLTARQHVKYLLKTESRLNTVKENLVQYIHRSDNLFNYANVGIIEIDLKGNIKNANHAFIDLLGYERSILPMLNFFQIIDENDLCNLDKNLQNLIAGRTEYFKIEIHCYKNNKESLWLIANLSAVRNVNDQPESIVCQLQNITDQKKAEKNLKHMAYHDSLTSLPNRHKLEQFLAQALEASKRYNRNFALLFLDLDHFKQINDTIGHEAGDSLLKIVAERLLGILRRTDLVARLGGDEFVLVITDIQNSEVLSNICEKLLDAIRKPITISGQSLFVTASIGVSIFPENGTSVKQLMQHADLALYKAKDKGRNNYQYYTSEMTVKAKHKMDLQNSLAEALNKNEFELNYQPILDTQSRKIVGVEALLRWQNEKYCMVSPDEIIKIAEEMGLIMDLSRWVLRRAAQQLNVWHKLGFQDLTMSVNCSDRQFRQGHLIDDLMKISQEVGVEPQYICIEVTEELIMSNPEKILRALTWIKKKGFKVSIDDFGTGYWSMKHLESLQVDQIKIDKSFINKLGTDEITRTMVSAIISMHQKMHIDIVAEGVENKEQYLLLEKENCHKIQGYYLTQPLSAKNMLEFLHHPVPDAEKITSNEIIA